LNQFLQVDTFIDGADPECDIMCPNPDTGVCVHSGLTEELMGTCNEVRVLISKKVTKNQAILCLKEVLRVIKSLDCEPGDSLVEAREKEDGIPF